MNDKIDINIIYSFLYNYNIDKKSKFKIRKYKKQLLIEIPYFKIEICIFNFSAALIENELNYVWMFFHHPIEYLTYTYIFEINHFNHLKHEKFIEFLCKFEIFEYGFNELLKIIEKSKYEEILDLFK